MKDTLTRVTKYILDVMFYAGILVTLSLPITIKWYGTINSFFQKHYVSQIILFAISGVLALLIVYELRKMFKTVLAEDCFVLTNVVSLRKMGTYSLMIAFVTACRMILSITPATLVVIIVFIIAGLFSKVLSRVFDRAVAYKLENDFTI